MKRTLIAITSFAFAVAAVCWPAASQAADGWISLFDGKTLNGWDGDPRFWTVQDGAITGTTTADNTTTGNTFVIYVGDNDDKTPVEFGDFMLTAEYRIVGHNSGLQYRSFKLPGEQDGWRVGGYQADFDAAKQWAGTNYGEKFRGILAKRGEKAILKSVQLPSNGKPVLQREVTAVGETEELAKSINDAPEWNKLAINARGHRLVQKINGVIMSEVIDRDKENRRGTGLIALQLHQGPPMTIQMRKVKIKLIEAKVKEAAKAKE